jgi:hypothetical protein
MDSYTDRISKFNDMVSDTADHIQAVRDAATKWDDSDPVGSALNITGAAAGGVGGLSGSYAAIQHYGDFKKMYKRIGQRLGKKSTDNPSGGAKDGDQGGGDGTSGAPENSNAAGAQSRGNAAGDQDGAASNPTGQGTASQPAQSASGGQDVDAGISDRISNLGSSGDTTAEANSINRAINAKADQLGDQGRNLLSDTTRATGRANDLKTADTFDDGDLKTAIQQDFLEFKNNVANDALSRANSGRPQASGYDKAGNPTGDAPGPQAQAAGGDVLRTPADFGAAPDGSTGGGAIAPDPNAAPIVNAAGDATTDVDATADATGSLIQRGQAALANLRPTQVPGSMGARVQGLANQTPDMSQGANAASRLQQGLADQTQGARSALAHPNTGGGQNANPGQAQASGTDGGGSAPGADGASGGVQPSSAGAGAADAEDAGTLVSRATNAAGTASKVVNGISDVSDVGDAMDLMAGMAGPAAPIVALVGGLISLGTTIAGLFHHKPKPKEEDPPPQATQTVGANLSSTQSMGGAGIY